MGKIIKDTIHANGMDIGIYTSDFENEFISLTDIARYKSNEPKDVIKNWMRSKDTLEFLGLWEKLHNANFKGVEFDAFKNLAGSNSFTMSPQKWIESTAAIGIVSKSGRYGGTYAHSDIAFEFASWISPEFKLYIINDYKRGIVNMCGNFSASVIYPFAAIKENSMCRYQCQGFPRSGACTLDTDICIC